MHLSVPQLVPFSALLAQVAGSSTVFPVANAWANGLENASNFAITIEGGMD